MAMSPDILGDGPAPGGGRRRVHRGTLPPCPLAHPGPAYDTLTMIFSERRMFWPRG